MKYHHHLPLHLRTLNPTNHGFFRRTKPSSDWAPDPTPHLLRIADSTLVATIKAEAASRMRIPWSVFLEMTNPKTKDLTIEKGGYLRIRHQ